MTLSIAPSLLRSLDIRGRLPHRLERMVGAQELFDRTLLPIADLGALERNETVWCGVGVGSRRISRALPLDVLVLLYAQEMTRRTLGLPRSHILVADTNALQGGLAPREVEHAAERTCALLRATTALLRFPALVCRASELVDVSAVPPPPSIGASNNPYVGQQLMQMEWMRRMGAKVKVGWRLSSALADELAFDRLYTSSYENRKVFLYTTPGRTLDPKRPRACPYLCDTPENRLLLAPGEQLARKLEVAMADPNRAAAAAGYKRLLGKLARAHVRLTGEGDAREPEAVLQTLVDQLSV